MGKVFMTIISLVLVLVIFSTLQVNVEAKATKKAMKFLKGTWIIEGDSSSKKIIFTRKYAKEYDLWNKSQTKVKSPKRKGKYLGKAKIISTKKKGKNWLIKMKRYGGYYYYKGYGRGLNLCWRENGKWEYNYRYSLYRYSRKVYK
ncbi:MAG: hypothetical protein IJF94_05575 [Eubacterium sp.]|nr:hypothetical protein [Eubacterium sp.]